jgi:hypothetical protein
LRPKAPTPITATLIKLSVSYGISGMRKGI